MSFFPHYFYSNFFLLYFTKVLFSKALQTQAHRSPLGFEELGARPPTCYFSPHTTSCAFMGSLPGPFPSFWALGVSQGFSLDSKLRISTSEFITPYLHSTLVSSNPELSLWRGPETQRMARLPAFSLSAYGF